MENQNKVNIIKQLLESTQANINQIERLVSEIAGLEPSVSFSSEPRVKSEEPAIESEGKIVEGIFDGQKMIASDGKSYNVPANYASKSKLVEGDSLKLTITNSGSFIYKQIGPIERERLVGTLMYDDETAAYRVMVNDEMYSVLTASVTYFKGEPGDDAVILVPKEGKSAWAAVENIVKKVQLGGESTVSDVYTKDNNEESTVESII